MAKTVEKAIQDFIALRDARDALKAEYTRRDEALVALQGRIEGWLLQQAETLQSDQFSVAAGTAFKKTTDKYSISDAEVFYSWVNEVGAAEMLQRRVSPEAVKGYMAEEGALPPGISSVREVTMQIRRK